MTLAIEPCRDHGSDVFNIDGLVDQEVVGTIDMAQMQALSEEELREEILSQATAICDKDPHLRSLGRWRYRQYGLLLGPSARAEPRVILHDESCARLADPMHGG